MYNYILDNYFQNQRAFNSWPQWPLHCNVKKTWINVENSADCSAGFKRKTAQYRWWPGTGTEILKTHQHSVENAANVQYFWQKMEVLYVPICAELKTCGGGSQGRNWSWRPPQSSPGTRGVTIINIFTINTTMSPSSTGLMTGATPDLNINNWCFVGTFIILSLLHL